MSSRKVASFPPPSGGGEKVPSQVLREMFFGNSKSLIVPIMVRFLPAWMHCLLPFPGVAEAVNCAEWVSNTTAPSGPPKEQDG